MQDRKGGSGENVYPKYKGWKEKCQVDLCLVARTEAEAWFLVKVSDDLFVREGDLVKLEDEEEFFTVMEVSRMYDKAAEKMLMEAYDMAEVEKLYKVSWEVSA